jgi:hypothetical protein
LTKCFFARFDPGAAGKEAYSMRFRWLLRAGCGSAGDHYETASDYPQPPPFWILDCRFSIIGQKL